jgi:hypothetical protein
MTFIWQAQKFTNRVAGEDLHRLNRISEHHLELTQFDLHRTPLYFLQSVGDVKLHLTLGKFRYRVLGI